MTERERQILEWIRENPMISQQELADKAGIARSSAAVHISNMMKKGIILGKGYIIHEEDDMVVIGGVNMDICGTPSQTLIPADSNPGRVTMSLGGVGRNIAHNLRLLSQPVRLITAFGDDLHAAKIQNSCRELGIDVSDSLVIPGAATSSYLFITDENGEMQLAVSDMEIYRHLTPEFLSGKLDLIERACLCVVDTNIPQESIEFLAERVNVPLFVDPVSTTKMHKLKNVLGKIHTFKPNRLEAELLTGIPITDEASLKQAAHLLLDTGMKRVFISLGEKGVYAADQEESILLPSIPTHVRNTTGGGDCFMAGLAYAYKKNLSLAQSAQIALAAGSICSEGEHTINEELSERSLYERAGIRYSEDADGGEPDEA